MSRFFILVPSIAPAGPIKGAIALANAIAEVRPVTLVNLKPGFGAQAMPISPKVTQVSLADVPFYAGKLRAYRKLLADAGGRGEVVSISVCFSADMVNFFCKDVAVIAASIRGNLFANYWMDHNVVGVTAAFVHYLALYRFDAAIAMTHAMARQVERYSRRESLVIGNCIDESNCEPYRRALPKDGPLRFVFVASLSHRKQPILLIRAIHRLKEEGHEVHLDIIGKGKLQEACEKEIARLRLGAQVTLRGSMPNPFPAMAEADAFVLPSLSEGVSRASLEAMYLGLPVVLRDVDGNAEIVRNGINGYLFRKNEDLPHFMLAAAHLARQGRAGQGLASVKAHTDTATRPPLMLDFVRQQTVAMQYVTSLEEA